MERLGNNKRNIHVQTLVDYEKNPAVIASKVTPVMLGADKADAHKREDQNEAQVIEENGVVHTLQ